MVTYTALNDASSNGAGSPKEAVSTAISALQKGDLIGLLDDLPPGERAAISGPLQDDVTSLKRLGVLTPAADPHKVTGVTFTASGITFASAPVVVNDHVQIVRLTGGTFTANADALKLPLTAHMLDLTHASSATPTTQRVDLSTVSGGVRIATVKEDGHWYVSLFYTIADSAANHQIPSQADYVAAHGASSPEAAVQNIVSDALHGNLADALSLVSPDELGAVHDYGGLILQASSGFGDTGVKVTTLDLNQTPLSDGAVKLTVAKLALTTPDGQNISVQSTGSCYAITANGQTKTECAADAITEIEGLVGSLDCLRDSGSDSESIGPDGLPDSGSSGSSGDGSCGPDLTAAQKTALTHLISGLTKIGVVAGESGGQWYLEPVRSVTELTAETIGSLQGDDIFDLVSIFTG